MSTNALPWFEDDNQDELRRWLTAALAVLCLHAAGIGTALYLLRDHNVEVGGQSAVISLELTAPQTEAVEQPNVEAPAPPQQAAPEQKAAPPSPPQQAAPEQQTVAPPTPPQVAPPQPQATKPPPPEKTAPDATAPPKPPPPPPTPPQVEQTKPVAPAAPAAPAAPPVPATPAAPPVATPSDHTAQAEIARAPRLDPNWTSQLYTRLQEAKSYPEGAHQRREEGQVVLTFVVDRNGRVTSRRIVQSSGHADLDAEAMALVDRAQPLPVFPPTMTQNELTLTVPIRFSLH